MKYLVDFTLSSKLNLQLVNDLTAEHVKRGLKQSDGNTPKIIH